MNISRTIAQVTLPAYSQIQDDLARLEKAFFKVFRYNALACIPFSIFLIIIAPEIIFLFLGSKWVPMLTAFRILCILGLFRGTATIVGSLILGYGRPHQMKNIKLAEFIIFAPLIYPAARFGGIEVVSLLTTAVYAFSLMAHLFYARRIINAIVPFFFKIAGTIIGFSTAVAVILYFEKVYFFTQPTLGGLLCLITTALLLYTPFSLLLLKRTLTT